MAGSTVTHKVIVRLWSPDGPWAEFYYTNPQEALAKLYEIGDANPKWDDQAPAWRKESGPWIPTSSVECSCNS